MCFHISIMKPEAATRGVWGPIVANLNLNHQRKFKPHLNFIKKMKIKLLLAFLIDLYCNLYLVFNLLC